MNKIKTAEQKTDLGEVILSKKDFKTLLKLRDGAYERISVAERESLNNAMFHLSWNVEPGEGVKRRDGYFKALRMLGGGARAKLQIDRFRSEVGVQLYDCNSSTCATTAAVATNLGRCSF